MESRVVKVLAHYDLRPIDPHTGSRDPDGVEPAACQRCNSKHYIVVEMRVNNEAMSVGTGCAQKLLGKPVLSKAITTYEKRREVARLILDHYRVLKSRSDIEKFVAGLDKDGVAMPGYIIAKTIKGRTQVLRIDPEIPVGLCYGYVKPGDRLYSRYLRSAAKQSIYLNGAYSKYLGGASRIRVSDKGLTR